MTALWLRDKTWVPQHWLGNFWVRVTVEHEVLHHHPLFRLFGYPPPSECRYVAARIPCLRPNLTDDPSRLHIAVIHFTGEAT